MFLRSTLLAALALALFTGGANAAPPEASETLWRAKMMEALTADLKVSEAAIAAAPESVPLYSRRGDCHLFLGSFPEAVADFEKMITLDPTQDAPHWRLGIAYFFAGKLEKSARQFEKYHAHDARDRENGIWKFLAEAHGVGLEKARSSMLPYTRFDREPFPALYEMFAGRKTTAEVFAGIESKGLGSDERVLFFANYYAGLHEDLLGHREKARELLRKAVASPWGRTAEDGPSYMWQVARLHAERIGAKPE